MPEQTPSPQSFPPPRQGVQFAIVFLAGAAVALIAHRLVQSRSTSPPETQRFETAAALPQSRSSSETTTKAKPLPTRRIDLNRAERHELLPLPGVGPSMADGILAYRDAKGPFQRVEDLRGVRGIGVNTLEKLKPWLVLDPGESDEPIRLERKKSESTKTTGGIKPEFDGQLDLNKATAADLERLPGIGPTLAQRIVDEREKKAFARIDELKRVYGIGPKKLEQIKPFVTVRP